MVAKLRGEVDLPIWLFAFGRSIKGDRGHRPATGTPTLRQLAPSRSPATAATDGKAGTTDTLWILLNSGAASPTKLALYAHHLKHEHSHLGWQMGIRLERRTEMGPMTCSRESQASATPIFQRS